MALAALVKRRLSSLLNRDTYITLGAIAAFLGATTAGLLLARAIISLNSHRRLDEGAHEALIEIGSLDEVNSLLEEKEENSGREEISQLVKAYLPEWANCAILKHNNGISVELNHGDLSCEEWLSINEIENQDFEGISPEINRDDYITIEGSDSTLEWSLDIVASRTLVTKDFVTLNISTAIINSLGIFSIITFMSFLSKARQAKSLEKDSASKDDTIKSLRRADLDRLSQQSEFLDKVSNTLDRLAEGPVRTLHVWTLQQVESYSTAGSTPSSLLQAHHAATMLIEQLDKLKSVQNLNELESDRVFPESSYNNYLLNIDALCRGLVESYGYDIDLTLKGDCGLVSTDASLIDRCLKELIENAVIYSSPHPETEGVQLEVDCEADDELIFYVRDRGIGIPPEDLPFITQLFIRGSNLLGEDINLAQARIGAGLFIASQAAKALGGQLTIRNRDGGGVEAKLSIPRNRPSTQS